MTAAIEDRLPVPASTLNTATGPASPPDGTLRHPTLTRPRARRGHSSVTLAPPVARGHDGCLLWRA